jgi:5-methylcytosine-specific restriction enzyme subunit McrC
VSGPDEIHLREWETLRPDAAGSTASRALAGRRLSDENARRLATDLADAGTIEVLELAGGLRIRATSFVGRLSLGDLVVTVEPKLPRAPLIQLLKYAYGLRHLDLYDAVDYAPTKWAFQDLLVQQLAAEVRELLAHGLHRDYEITRGDLHSPRGRIDFRRYVQVANGASTTLPCVYHPRLEDTLLNQTLLAGLRFASELTDDLNLRGPIRRLASMLGTSVSPQALHPGLLGACRSRLDRRTTSYEPAITIIELLYGETGIALETPIERVRLKGFLFDMNRFFQALVARFLVDHLEECEVEEESRLNDLLVYDPLRNPLCRRAPAPRPDFVIRRDAEVIAVLDAKYRDLWESSLPREMLYQLALYALGQQEGRRRSAILYPVLDRAAREQGILIRDPLFARHQAEVILRPINLIELDEMIRGGPAARRRRMELARRLAFGEAAVSNMVPRLQ